MRRCRPRGARTWCWSRCSRSEEHTSELQSRLHLVCRLLLEKKNNIIIHHLYTPFIINVTMTDSNITIIYITITSTTTTQWRKTDCTNGVYLESLNGGNSTI